MKVVVLKSNFKSYSYKGLIIGESTDWCSVSRAAGVAEGDVVAELDCTYKFNDKLHNIQFVFKSFGEQGKFELRKGLLVSDYENQEEVSEIIRLASIGGLRSETHVRMIAEMIDEEDLFLPPHEGVALYEAEITLSSEGLGGDIILSGPESDFIHNSHFGTILDIQELSENHALLVERIGALHNYILGLGEDRDDDLDEDEESSSV